MRLGDGWRAGVPAGADLALLARRGDLRRAGARRLHALARRRRPLLSADAVRARRRQARPFRRRNSSRRRPGSRRRDLLLSALDEGTTFERSRPTCRRWPTPTDRRVRRFARRDALNLARRLGPASRRGRRISPTSSPRPGWPTTRRLMRAPTSGGRRAAKASRPLRSQAAHAEPISVRRDDHRHIQAARLTPRPRRRRP